MAVGIEDWRQSDAKVEVVEQLSMHALLLNGAPDINGETKVFQWLDFWMNLTGIRPEISAQELFDEAWASIQPTGNS